MFNYAVHIIICEHTRTMQGTGCYKFFYQYVIHVDRFFQLISV